MRNAFFLLPAAVMLLASCSARIEGTLSRDGSAELAIRASLEPRMAALIRSLDAASGSGSAGEAVIDGAAIGRSMAAAPGISSVSLRNVSPATVEGTISVSRIDQFLMLPESRGGGRLRFIQYEQGSGGGRLVISLDRDSAPQLVSLISEDVAEYLSALMAPAATGEVLTRAEYLVLAASVYGKAVADEIAAAKIDAVFDFPGPVGTVRGGSFQGSRVRFEVPLLDLLVLESPLSYEVTWK
jgi:hypothetical protein